MRFVLAFLLAAHGIAHLAGFISSWELTDNRGASLQNDRLLGALGPGGRGHSGHRRAVAARRIGLCGCGDRAGTGVSWAGRFMLPAVIASALLCVAGWPDARIGLAVNVGLALVLAIVARSIRRC